MKELIDILEDYKDTLKMHERGIRFETNKWVDTQKKIIRVQEALDKLKGD